MRRLASHAAHCYDGKKHHTKAAPMLIMAPLHLDSTGHRTHLNDSLCGP